MSDMYDNFNKYFEIVIADTSELLENVYKIRYQVLCEEQRIPGFDPSLYPDKMEKDNYDSHSSHVLLRFRPSGDFIGTVRLVLFDFLQPEKLFPVESYAQFDPALCNIETLSRLQTAEISRFVVVSRFDRRKEDRRTSRTDNPAESPADIERRAKDRRSTPSIALILMAGVMRLSVKYNIKNWISGMEPALNRLLSYSGLTFNLAGPPVNYHGIRQAYYVKVEDALARIYKEHYDAWEVLTECGKYNPMIICK
jgi:N-acyl amino acid synthase of PEP-CTERM/exosortase system